MSKFWPQLFTPDFSRLRHGGSRRPSKQKSVGVVEFLEERTLLSTFTVANNLDSGEGSLRAAMELANANPGADTIAFEIGTGTVTIQPLSALPNITDPVTIDGTTQPGSNGVPSVILNGDLLPAESFVDGLVVNTTNSLIKGLVVNGFDEGTGIVIGGFDSTGVMGNHVEGCIIGLNAAGTAAVLNSNGIRIGNGAQQNTIGGAGAARNVISGNGFGVAIEDPGTTGNRVLGNFIGTSFDGSTAIGNGYGVGIVGGAFGNDVGGIAAGEGNLISGNVNNGILILGEDTAHNNVLGNRIGTNAAGTASLGDFTTSSGISLSLGTHDNVIGGTTPGARNQIAGLSSDGIAIFDPETFGNLIQGNYIGVSADGTTGIPNGGDGIFIIESPGNVIGGESAGAGNVISGSSRNGVTIFGDTATENVVWGNYIGTSANGKVAIPNSVDGIRIDGAGGNSIGGTTSARSNVISGNAGNGVTIVGDGADLNLIEGNLIGVASDAVAALPNGGTGIAISEGASQNLVGGESNAAWNTIAFNGFKGVVISDATSLGNTIRGNRIFSNQFIAIDLNNDGVSANDALDADAGPNGLQNVPVLNSANASGGFLFVGGTLNAKANATYTLEFYASTSNDSEGNGQGATPITAKTVTTTANGSLSVNFVLNTVVSAGQFLTVTATDSLGNTSEFSASKLIGSAVPPNPILTLSDATINYQLHQAAVIVDATAVVTDPDSANFNAGKITVSFNSKGEKGEKLAIRIQGDGEGQIGKKGQNIKFGGVIVGKANGGGGGAGKKPLIITLNANATPAIVTALLKNITYSHNGKKTALTTRRLTFKVSDGAGHDSNSVDKLILVSAATST